MATHSSIVTLFSSQTQTATSNEASTSRTATETNQPAVAEQLVLKLVPKKKKKAPKEVKWSEETVDNEFMNKKKSKKCCIFHKQRQFGEWSEDEDSDVECDHEQCQE